MCRLDDGAVRELDSDSVVGGLLVDAVACAF